MPDRELGVRPYLGYGGKLLCVAQLHFAHAGDYLFGIANGRRSTSALTTGKSHMPLGHIKLAVACLYDNTDIGCRVQSQQRGKRKLGAFCADVENGGDGCRILVDDKRYCA